jgi:hypothetical protein
MEKNAETALIFGLDSIVPESLSGEELDAWYKSTWEEVNGKVEVFPTCVGVFSLLGDTKLFTGLEERLLFPDKRGKPFPAHIIKNSQISLRAFIVAAW